MTPCIMTTVIPITRNMLEMFEPITFAATIPGSPLYIEKMDVASSGREVPRATTVTPMINCGTPSDSPIFSE